MLKRIFLKFSGSLTLAVALLVTMYVCVRSSRPGKGKFHRLSLNDDEEEEIYDMGSKSSLLLTTREYHDDSSDEEDHDLYDKRLTRH